MKTLAVLLFLFIGGFSTVAGAVDRQSYRLEYVGPATERPSSIQLRRLEHALQTCYQKTPEPLVSRQFARSGKEAAGEILFDRQATYLYQTRSALSDESQIDSTIAAVAWQLQRCQKPAPRLLKSGASAAPYYRFVYFVGDARQRAQTEQQIAELRRYRAAVRDRAGHQTVRIGESCPSLAQPHRVRIIIDNSGRLVSTHTEQSSGFPLCDKAVHTALRRSSPFAAPPESIVPLLAKEGLVEQFIF